MLAAAALDGRQVQNLPLQGGELESDHRQHAAGWRLDRDFEDRRLQQVLIEIQPYRAPR